MDEHPPSPLMQQLPFDLKMTIIKLVQDESPKDQFEKHILDVVCGKSEAVSPEESKWVEYAKWVKNPPQQETTKKSADKKKPRSTVDAGIQAARSVDHRRKIISQHEKEGVMADVGFLASPSCPTCGDVMKQRFPGEGTVKGNAFWGCSGYPKCRGTRKMDRIDVLRSLRDDIGEDSSDEVKWDHGDDDLKHDPWDY